MIADYNCRFPLNETKMEEEAGQLELSNAGEKTSQTSDKAEMNRKPTSGKEMQPEPEEKVNEMKRAISRYFCHLSSFFIEYQ